MEKDQDRYRDRRERGRTRSPVGPMANLYPDLRVEGEEDLPGYRDPHAMNPRRDPAVMNPRQDPAVMNPRQDPQAMNPRQDPEEQGNERRGQEEAREDRDPRIQMAPDQQLRRHDGQEPQEPDGEPGVEIGGAAGGVPPAPHAEGGQQLLALNIPVPDPPAGQRQEQERRPDGMPRDPDDPGNPGMPHRGRPEVDHRGHQDQGGEREGRLHDNREPAQVGNQGEVQPPQRIDQAFEPPGEGPQNIPVRQSPDPVGEQPIGEGHRDGVGPNQVERQVEGNNDNVPGENPQAIVNPANLLPVEGNNNNRGAILPIQDQRIVDENDREVENLGENEQFIEGLIAQEPRGIPQFDQNENRPNNLNNPHQEDLRNHRNVIGEGGGIHQDIPPLVDNRRPERNSPQRQIGVEQELPQGEQVIAPAPQVIEQNIGNQRVRINTPPEIGDAPPLIRNEGENRGLPGNAHNQPPIEGVQLDLDYMDNEGRLRPPGIDHRNNPENQHYNPGVGRPNIQREHRPEERRFQGQNEGPGDNVCSGDDRRRGFQDQAFGTPRRPNFPIVRPEARRVNRPPTPRHPAQPPRVGPKRRQAPQPEFVEHPQFVHPTVRRLNFAHQENIYRRGDQRYPPANNNPREQGRDQGEYIDITGEEDGPFHGNQPPQNEGFYPQGADNMQQGREDRPDRPPMYEDVGHQDQGGQPPAHDMPGHRQPQQDTLSRQEMMEALTESMKYMAQEMHDGRSELDHHLKKMIEGMSKQQGERQSHVHKKWLEGPKKFKEPTVMRSAKDFMEEFKEYMKDLGVRNELWVKCVRNHLEDTAEEHHVRYVKKHGRDSFEHYQKLFEEEFKDLGPEERKKKFHLRTYVPGEDMKKFNEELKTLLAASTFSKPDQIDQYTVTLPKNIQDQIMVDTPETLDKAMRMAQRLWLQEQRFGKNTTIAHLAAQFVLDQKGEYTDEATEGDTEVSINNMYQERKGGPKVNPGKTFEKRPTRPPTPDWKKGLPGRQKVECYKCGNAWMSTYGPDSGKPSKDNINECFKCGHTWTSQYFPGSRPASQEWISEMYDAAEEDRRKQKKKQAKRVLEAKESGGNYNQKVPAIGLIPWADQSTAQSRGGPGRRMISPKRKKQGGERRQRLQNLSRRAKDHRPPTSLTMNPPRRRSQRKKHSQKTSNAG